MTSADIFLSLNYHPTDGGRILTKRVGMHTFVLRAPTDTRPYWLWENLCTGLHGDVVSWEQIAISEDRPTQDVLLSEAHATISVGNGTQIVPHRELPHPTVKDMIAEFDALLEEEETVIAERIIDRVRKLVGNCDATYSMEDRLQ